MTVSPLLGLRRESVAERAGFLGDRLVIGIACGIEQRPYLLVSEPIDELRLAQCSFAAAADDLLHQPPEILLRMVAPWQGVYRTLDGYGAQGLESAPDLDAEICRLRRQLMDQQEPGWGRCAMHDTSVSERC
jgi:hypothetical protein